MEGEQRGVRTVVPVSRKVYRWVCLPFCTLSNNLHMFCLPFGAMNDSDADDNAADARDVSLKGGCLIPFVARLCC